MLEDEIEFDFVVFDDPNNSANASLPPFALCLFE